ncbi:glycoside hydrolase family 32 protein [Salinicoccus hispanicus]|uniref:Sucrose-6-phosphate hydrolase n=1 Tax=Salinicoccus hispanicus TaxID=157225 RepID=A0A6N8U1P2_9STAP|nr:sucrose-6-phosphate hydrolase [Salinicoccus hispanicus]MXQ52000.1 sucrose-6-phosphate hydrolase [Salinicoccus hispanicus]
MSQKSEYQTNIDEQIEGNRRFIETDTHRMSYHLMPPVGLLNDPNGLIYHEGIYHAFFQWNPFETAHGKKAWGHYTSKNLVDWSLAPVALAPDQWYDKNGCYSGSAIVHEGVMHLFYTGNVKDADDRRSSYQCLAISEDGITFEKKGPVLHLPEGYTAHFRDPKVWKDGDHWLMILGAQNAALKGEAVLARSSNLTDWEFLGPIAGSGMNGLGNFGYMWECPDLFNLDGKDVLIVCPQGLDATGEAYHNLYQAGYFAGDFDSTDYSYDHGEFQELDRGFDFYAPQTFTDDEGRRILIGWMGMTDDQEQNQPTIENNWLHALTIPRVLEMRNNQLVQHPIPELEQLRGERRYFSQLELEKDVAFREAIAPSSEILLEFTRPVENTFELEIRSGLKIIYDRRSFIVERNTFDGKTSEQRAFSLARLSDMQIFLDGSSVEIFVNGGEVVCSSRYFPQEKDDAIEIRGHMHFDLSLWKLEGSTIDMF